jgi:hypothetical protein
VGGESARPSAVRTRDVFLFIIIFIFLQTGAKAAVAGGLMKMMMKRKWKTHRSKQQSSEVRE